MEWPRAYAGRSDAPWHRSSHPLVAAVTDAQGRSVTTTLHRNTADPAYAITGPAADDKHLLSRVPPERLYGYAQAGALT